MMGFLFEYTPGKVTWKIKHHPIEKENDLESQTKKQTPFWGVQNMIFSREKSFPAVPCCSFQCWEPPWPS